MCKETITKTQAVYNRSKKTYQVIAPWGEIVTEFPSGPQGKQAAELEAIRQDNPKAYQAAAHLRFYTFNAYPMTHSRIWKAARIVANGDVYKAHPLSQYNTREAYHVKSQSEQRFYEVTRPDDFYTCTCPDFDEFHAPTIGGQKLCKHIFAVKIMKAAEQTIPAYLDSPKNLFRWLEETGSPARVIGTWNKRPYLYAEPQHRPAVAGEIVEDADGQTWRLVHNGQRFNYWRIDLPEARETAAPAANASKSEEAPTPAQLYEEAQLFEEARRNKNAVKINQYERGLRERSQLEGQQAAIRAFEERSAAVNAGML